MLLNIQDILSYSIVAILFTSVSAFSDASYNYMIEMADWSSVGYCIHNLGWYDIPNLEAPDLTTGTLKDSCPLLDFCTSDEPTVEIVQIFNPILTNAQIAGTGFIALDHAKQRVLIIFRGSATVGDWLSDFEFLLIPYQPITKDIKIDYAQCEDCFVHKGVYKTVENLSQQAFPTLIKLREQYPSYKFITTGHSLGGGVVTLAGLEFQLMGFEPSVISFAGLKIGNPSFGEHLDKVFKTDEFLDFVLNEGDISDVNGYTRVVHQADIVPLIPPTSIFAHGGIEFYINKIELPHPKSVVEFKGKYEYEPLTSQALNILSQPSLGKILTVYEHNHYYVSLYGCGAPSIVDLIPGASDPNENMAKLANSSVPITRLTEGGSH